MLNPFHQAPPLTAILRKTGAVLAYAGLALAATCSAAQAVEPRRPSVTVRFVQPKVRGPAVRLATERRAPLEEAPAELPASAATEVHVIPAQQQNENELEVLRRMMQPPVRLATPPAERRATMIRMPKPRVEPATFQRPAPAAPSDVSSASPSAAVANEINAPHKSMQELSVDIQPGAGELPPSIAPREPGEPAQPSRGWTGSIYAWEAPGVCHQPLYFEQVNVERYGYTAGRLQPTLSAAHFFGTIPMLPYLVGAQPARECVYTLGYYRPGNRVPFQRPLLPLSLRGAIFEVGAATGLVFFVP